jgi:hypothetical protein
MEFTKIGLGTNPEIRDACQEAIQNIKNGKSEDFKIVFAYISGFLFGQYAKNPKDFQGFKIEECIGFIYEQLPRSIELYDNTRKVPFHLYFFRRIKGLLMNLKNDNLKHCHLNSDSIEF